MDTTSRRGDKPDGIEAKLDLMRRRMSILRVLYPNALMTETELAEKVGIEKGNFNRNLDALEAAGLVSTYRDKASGNDRRMVSLTDLSIEVISAFEKREPTSAKESLTDDKYVASTLGLLLDKDQEVRRVAARELVDISKSYILPQGNGVLLYMDYGLTGEKDPKVLSNLLEAISTTITNSPETRDQVRNHLVTQLSTIATEKGKVVDRRSTDLAIKILANACEGESRYELLLSIYGELVKNVSQSSRTVIDALIANSPEKRGELRQSLLKLFKETSGEGRNLIQGQLTII